MTSENATPATAAPRYPLANDAHGNPLEVPPEAVAWRVRKLARRAGRPKVLFDAETGRPLEVPLAASFDDLVDLVNDSGRFRLEAVDAQGRIIPGCVAVTEVVFDDEPEEVAAPRNAAEAMPELMRLVAQLVDSNAQVMKAMASAFGQVQPSQPLVIERSAEKKDQSELQVGKLVSSLLQHFAGQPNENEAATATAATPTGGAS